MTKPPSAPEAPELADLRRQVADCDSQIIALLAQRHALSLAIGRVKKHAGLPVQDSQQEQLLFAAIEATAKAQGLDPAYIANIYRIIIAESIKAQQDL